MTARPAAMAGLLLAMLAGVLAGKALANKTYLAPEQFLAEVFQDDVPAPQVVWLSGARGQIAQDILGHKPGSLRVRFWSRENSTTWILDEVGKEKPITVGITIGSQGIERLKILVYRENRGAEVRHSFFTEQFIDANIDDETQLDRRVDNITGATLSVSAIQRVARLALFLHGEVTN